MTEIQFFTQLVASVWQGMSEIQVPLLHIPVTSFLLGTFVAGFSIMILRPILGIGYGGSISLRIRRKPVYNNTYNNTYNISKKGNKI